MKIQSGDEVRLHSTRDTNPFSFPPDKDTWLRVGKRTERGWQAYSMEPKNPLIMTIMDPLPHLFIEQDVIEHRPGPWWIKLAHILLGMASVQRS